ncbi:MAG: peptidylprolyl isomerase [Gammaproteobacteria bacterium]|nr:peptidylprolyl isomerase [Gammaproteobacteria bacterium]
MNQRFAPAACTALLLVLTGCDGLSNAATTPADTNVAFEAFVKAAARKSASELTPDELKEAITAYTGMQVAAEAGIKAGLDKDQEVKGQLVLSRANVLSETLLQRWLDENPITDADIQAEYDAQVAGTPPEYSARHILVDDKALAEAIIQKLQAGGDFAALAKEHSKDGSAQNGGDLGWFNPQSMVPPFADAVVKLEKGKFSLSPVETQFGWHVIKLEDVRTASLPPLDQVKDRVRQLVQRKKVTAHLEELRKESKIDIDKLTADLTAYAATPKEPVAAAPAPAGNTPEAPAATP